MEKGDTKLSIDYGHVRNPLVTVVVPLTIEFFGAYINGGYFQTRFSTNLRINLSIAITVR